MDKCYNFLHRLLRCIVDRDGLPEKTDWDGLLSSGFTNLQLLLVSQFVEKTEFRTKAIRAAKGRIMLNERRSEGKIGCIASAVMGDMFISHVDQGRAYIGYVRKELLEHPTIKSDLVVALACFEFSFLFTLLKSQAAGCRSRLFRSFCVRRWLSRVEKYPQGRLSGVYG